MVLQYLHSRYVVGVNIVCGDSIVTLHQVESLDVEIPDGFSLIWYLSRLSHTDSRHLPQHIGYRLIVLREKGTDIIVDRVAVRIDLLRPDDDFLKLHHPLLRNDFISSGAVRYNNLFWLDIHSRCPETVAFTVHVHLKTAGLIAEDRNQYPFWRIMRIGSDTHKVQCVAIGVFDYSRYDIPAKHLLHRK